MIQHLALLKALSFAAFYSNRFHPNAHYELSLNFNLKITYCQLAVTARKYEGPGPKGIKLVNVRRIVARHGGRNKIQEEPDQRAAFHFTLP